MAYLGISFFLHFWAYNFFKVSRAGCFAVYEKIIGPFVHLSIKSLLHHENLSFILLHNVALRQVSLPLSIEWVRKLKIREVRRHRLTNHTGKRARHNVWVSCLWILLLYDFKFYLKCYLYACTRLLRLSSSAPISSGSLDPIYCTGQKHGSKTFFSVFWPPWPP